ncbi:putative transcription factor kapC [Cadophora sp. MPI-SDFR-AT-0126]|nr:putative transcription factor kapC [Leotiomycetes sp. MPI-SDFR-AT-0126]
MQSIAPAPGPQQDMNADNDLRAQLSAVINHAPGPHGYNDISHHSSSASPHDHNIDPAIGGPGGIMSTGGDSGGDDNSGDGRKGGKRELSQSKRAAQNRAAQRAFRQRKEGYIKKLEEQVRDLHNLEDNYKAIQTENYSLREYIIHLQSRLIESQGEYPQPPPNQHHDAPVAPMAPMNQLQASAARNIAAAGLQSGKHGQESREYEDSKRYKQSTEDSVEQEIRTRLGDQSAMSL